MIFLLITLFLSHNRINVSVLITTTTTLATTTSWIYNSNNGSPIFILYLKPRLTKDTFSLIVLMLLAIFHHTISLQQILILIFVVLIKRHFSLLSLPVPADPADPPFHPPHTPWEWVAQLAHQMILGWTIQAVRPWYMSRRWLPIQNWSFPRIQPRHFYPQRSPLSYILPPPTPLLPPSMKVITIYKVGTQNWPHLVSIWPALVLRWPPPVTLWPLWVIHPLALVCPQPCRRPFPPPSWTISRTMANSIWLWILLLLLLLTHHYHHHHYHHLISPQLVLLTRIVRVSLKLV